VTKKQKMSDKYYVKSEIIHHLKSRK